MVECNQTATMKKCSEPTTVWSRVCGYMRPVSSWNDAKQQEFKDRKTFDVSGII